ncbi:hypothetical protein AB0M61_48620 [Streptomyces sp. NPDC051642]|uniref:hypothetical protein n=1 Tax=Streptomyces sp. NPDC051642 TaxID=3154646 RepID=UPI003418811D
MQIIDLAEQTRLLGQVAPTLETLTEEVERVREEEILAPIDQLAPPVLRLHELAITCTRQLHDLSTSQYAAMTYGRENVAHLAEACAQVSLASALGAIAISSRTEILLYRGADPTPGTSRDHLRRACVEMDRAATTYHTLAQRLSRRLASAAARNEDQQLIDRSLAAPGAADPSTVIADPQLTIPPSAPPPRATASTPHARH